MKEELTDKERQLLAFAIFSIGMKIGPASFPHCESIVEKTGIKKEFEAYAKDWISQSEKLKATK